MCARRQENKVANEKGLSGYRAHAKAALQDLYPLFSYGQLHVTIGSVQEVLQKARVLETSVVGNKHFLDHWAKIAGPSICLSCHEFMKQWKVQVHFWGRCAFLAVLFWGVFDACKERPYSGG